MSCNRDIDLDIICGSDNIICGSKSDICKCLEANIPIEIRGESRSFQEMMFCPDVVKFSDFSRQNKIPLWLFSKPKTFSCEEAFNAKRSNINMLAENKCINLDVNEVQLGLELKTLIFCGRHLGQKIIIAFNLHGDSRLKNDMENKTRIGLPCSNGEKYYKGSLLEKLNKIGIQLDQLKFYSDLNIVKGTLNPISNYINNPNWIQIFDSSYRNKVRNIVTTNAGHNFMGSVFDLNNVFNAFDSLNKEYYFLDLA